MNRKYEIELELEELWQEYDSHYEASKDIMHQIEMAQSELESLDE